MRAIAAWRREMGIDYWRARGNWGRFIQWSAPGRGGAQVSVDLERGDDGPYAEMTAGKRSESGGLIVGDDRTLTEAVDVLVALGYLPSRFSSAYAEGWYAAMGPLFGGPIDALPPVHAAGEVPA